MNANSGDKPEGIVNYRLTQVEIVVRELDGKVDRLIMAVVAAALSFAASAVVVILTYWNAHG